MTIDVAAMNLPTAIFFVVAVQVILFVLALYFVVRARR